MSDFYNKYPYTDFHELNLDWVIERVKKFTEDWLTTQEAWNNTQEQWQQLYDYVHDYFDNLDVQDEINNKINAMIADGTFETVVTPIVNAQVADTVAEWLAAHITPTTPAIDDTLSVEGAGADAKVTGIYINNINKAIFEDLGILTDGYLDTDGTLIAATSHNEVTSDFISIDKINYIWAYASTSSQQLWARVLFYYADQSVHSYDTIVPNLTGTAFSGHLDIPDNVKYIRVSFRRMSGLNAFLNLSGAFITDYEKKLNPQLVLNRIVGIEPGYFEDDGTIHTPTANNEVYSDYIPVTFNHRYFWKYISASANPLFSRAILYNSSKVFIKKLDLLPTTTTQEAHGEFLVDASTAAYIRISFRLGSGYTNQFYFTSEVTDQIVSSLTGDIDSINSELTRLTEIQLDTFAGYIGSTANAILSISAQDPISLELTTDRMAAKAGDKFSFTLDYTTSRAAWAVCGVYDSSDFLIIRQTLLNGTMQHGSYNYTIPAAYTNAAYVRFSWRSYGEADVHIYSGSRLQSSFQMSADASKNLEYIMDKDAQIVKGINHQGYNQLAPNNTLPAFMLSKKMGFKYVETDLRFTSDDVPVLLHDDTINNTARNPDGTAIGSTIYIDQITYAQALTYDFGIWKGDQFAGTKIPTLDEFIKLCKYAGLDAYIEICPTTWTTAQKDAAFAVIDKYDMKDHVTWISSNLTPLQDAVSAYPTGRFGYVVGTAAASHVAAAAAMQTSDNEIFLDAHSYDASIVSACQTAGIKLEVWTLDTYNNIIGIDPYVSGVTSNIYDADYVLYNYMSHQFEGII